MQEFMALIYLIMLLYKTTAQVLKLGSDVKITGYIGRDAVIKTKV